MAGERGRVTNCNNNDSKNESSENKRFIYFEQKEGQEKTFLNWNPNGFNVVTCNTFLGNVKGVEHIHIKKIDTIDNCFVSLNVEVDKIQEKANKSSNKKKWVEKNSLCLKFWYFLYISIWWIL